MSATETRPTMADLLNRVADQANLKVGDKITGKIIFLAKNQALIEIPKIGLGIVRGRELYNEEFLSGLKVGQEMEAVILELDNEIGMMELSFREIGKDQIWEEIRQAYESGSVIECKVREANRGGFLVKVRGADGFLPASLLSPIHAIKNVSVEDNSLLNQMKKYVGESFSVKIININPESENMIVSEKAVSDEVAKAKLANYSVGQKVEGKVVGVVDFGIFVRFDDDLEGLCHISELAWKKVEDPRKHYKEGDTVEAKIVDIDDNGRINLSIKQLLENPWKKFAKTAKEGDSFDGVVTKIISYGAIITGENEIQGLCHISQITKTEILKGTSDIRKYLTEGEKDTFTVLKVESDEKLYLTLLPLDEAKKTLSKLETKSEEGKKQEDTENENSEEDSQED